MDAIIAEVVVVEAQQGAPAVGKKRPRTMADCCKHPFTLFAVTC